MSLAAGEVFAGHVVVRLLGSGPMGEVHLAEDVHTRRHDALRVLPAWVSADPAVGARFEREAAVAATLWHPHIVGVRGHGADRGRFWLATDLVEGTDAARLVRDGYPGGLPADEVVDIVTGVADALDYARGRQLTHGAVSLANILLTVPPGRRILLSDFGVPRIGPGRRDDLDALFDTARHLLGGTHGLAVPDPSARFGSCLDFAAALRDGLAGATATVASPIPLVADQAARLESPETGPSQPVFTPAWSAEPPPNPYLDPYPEDPDPAHSPTMTAIPVPAHSPPPSPPPPPPPPHADHPPGTAGRTWAMAGVAGVVVLVVVLVIVLVIVALSGGGGDAPPSARPQPATSAPPPPPAPTTEPTSTDPTSTGRGRAAPPPVAGPDGVGETCLDGYQITGQAGWASHGVRGNAAATCAFVGNVLKAYWDAADPSDALRTVVAAGAIPCTAGAQCSGADFVVTCSVEALQAWVTCRGGRDAVVYLY